MGTSDARNGVRKILLCVFDCNLAKTPADIFSSGRRKKSREALLYAVFIEGEIDARYGSTMLKVPCSAHAWKDSCRSSAPTADKKVLKNLDEIEAFMIRPTIALLTIMGKNLLTRGGRKSRLFQ